MLAVTSMAAAAPKVSPKAKRASIQFPCKPASSADQSSALVVAAPSSNRHASSLGTRDRCPGIARKPPRFHRASRTSAHRADDTRARIRIAERDRMRASGRATMGPQQRLLRTLQARPRTTLRFGLFCPLFTNHYPLVSTRSPFSSPRASVFPAPGRVLRACGSPS